MHEVLTNIHKTDRAVLIAVWNQRQSKEKTIEYLDELEFLASTINIETIHSFVQGVDMPEKRTFIGKGKLEEVRTYVIENEIEVVIFDDDLSPSQVRNLENELEVKIYDRSLLILDIFLFRAQTAQAKAQVELARSQYLLPRLTRMWTHLERQRGGTGTRGGAGEKEIETDKRNIRNKIARLKDRLVEIDKQRVTQRKGRDQQVRATLVGYTNVGKSTIMQLLTKSDVFAEDKLFATVDSTVRKTVINHIPFLLTDTVGFIRKLPHTLVECFKSTLDEVREADILIHVVDIAHDSFEEQIEIVNTTLGEIEAGDKQIIMIFNKIDKLQTEEGQSVIEDLKKSYLNKKNVSTVFISAQEKENVAELRQTIFNEVKEIYFRIFPNSVAQYDYLKYLNTEDFEPEKD